jgi:hypothetical protein
MAAFVYGPRPLMCHAWLPVPRLSLVRLSQVVPRTAIGASPICPGVHLRRHNSNKSITTRTPSRYRPPSILSAISNIFETLFQFLAVPGVFRIR